MSKEKKVSFDSIRGRVIDKIDFFRSMNCFGRCPSEFVSYHSWNVRNPNKKRVYHSPIVPYITYLMDEYGQRWASYRVNTRYTFTETASNYLCILAAITTKTQKDLENNRIAVFDLFKSPHLFLLNKNPHWNYNNAQVKTVALKNIPRHILPEENYSIELIAEDERQRLYELIDLKTNGNLTFDYIKSYNGSHTERYERITLINPKSKGEPIPVYNGSEYGADYQVSLNRLYQGYENGRNPPRYFNF